LKALLPLVLSAYVSDRVRIDPNLPPLEREAEERIDEMVGAVKRSIVWKTKSLPPASRAVTTPRVIDLGDHVAANVTFLGLVDATQKQAACPTVPPPDQASWAQTSEAQETSAVEADPDSASDTSSVITVVTAPRSLPRPRPAKGRRRLKVSSVSPLRYYPNKRFLSKM